MPDEGLAGLGQAYLPAAAHEERRADRGLQRLHLLADGGLGAAESAPRRREGAGGGHGAQHAEMTGFYHPTNIRLSWMARRKMRGNFERAAITLRP